MEVALFLIHDIVYNIDLFHDLTPEMLAKLLTVLKPLQASSGEILSIAGEIGREMYIIISGEMMMLKPDDHSKAILSAGEYFGELCALDINPINLSTVTALQPCELYSLSRDDVFNTFRDMPEVLGHMKDVALESFIVNHRLDADINEEDKVLNDFLAEKTAIAVDSKSTTLSTKDIRSKKNITRSSREPIDRGIGDDGNSLVGAPSPANTSRSTNRKTMEKKIAKGLSKTETNVGDVLTVDFNATPLDIPPSASPSILTNSTEIEDRLKALESKMDKLLSSMTNLSQGAISAMPGLSAASVMRQQALKEEHELHQASIAREKSISPTLKRVGSKHDISQEIGKGAQAALNYRRQSRMLLDMDGSGSAANGSSAGSNGRDARGNGNGQSGKEALDSVDER